MRHAFTWLLVAIYFAAAGWAVFQVIQHQDAVSITGAVVAVFPILAYSIAFLVAGLRKTAQHAQERARQRAADKLRPPMVS